MTNQRWFGKDMERSGNYLFYALSWYVPGEVGMLTTRLRCSVTYIHLLISFTHSLTRSRNVSEGCQRCLLTGRPDSTGGCQSALVDKLGDSFSQYHHTMVHIANRPGMNNKPVEAAALRPQSHPIIANQWVCTGTKLIWGGWHCKCFNCSRFHKINGSDLYNLACIEITLQAQNHCSYKTNSYVSYLLNFMKNNSFEIY
jgi:hypothetical protein